jgi:hypothetical protein
MKIVLGVLAVVMLLIGAQSVFAQTGAPLSKHPQAAYKSGFNHGLTDGKIVVYDRVQTRINVMVTTTT